MRLPNIDLIVDDELFGGVLPVIDGGEIGLATFFETLLRDQRFTELEV